jgi:hypothetical protein
MMPIKPRRGFIPGIDHQREHRGIGLPRKRKLGQQEGEVANGQYLSLKFSA